MIHRNSLRRSRRAARFGVHISVAALIAGLPAQAMAQCSPDPTQANTAVTCSGSDTNGIIIGTSGSPLTVASGATVSNTGGSAITVSIPATSSGTQRIASITVNGTVSASNAAGILLTTGAPYGGNYDFSGLAATITVAQGASVSGTTGISAISSSTFAPIIASLDNAGTITGTVGAAISASGTFNTITNRATGTMGAIATGFGSIQNDGVIDGGGMAAINTAGGYITGKVNNTGTIRSSNGVATIANTQLTLTNSGTISNSGGGAAIGATGWVSAINKAGATITANGAATIAAAGNLNVSNGGTITNTGTGGATISGGALSIGNLAGGVISAPTGGNALVATTSMGLTNAGTINGNVIATSAFAESFIDSTAGTVNGNVLLGNGNDTLVALYNNGALKTGITGMLNGGGGANTLKVTFADDATLSSALAMPTNFNLLNAYVNKGSTLTLANGFTASGLITIDGLGAVVNNTSLTGTAQVFAMTGSSASFTNAGTVTTTASGNYAVMGSNITNSGSISAAGSGVYTGGSFSNSGTINAATTGLYQYNGAFSNSGTISGNAYGVQIFSYGSAFSNSGTIRSSSGTGLYMVGSSYGSSVIPTNSGVISGVTGVQLAAALSNSGTITGNTGVQFIGSSVLTNLATGTITGANAIYNSAYGSSVVNFGTINGNVYLASATPQTQSANTTFVAKAGSMLNGNLTLGLGDTLVTTLTGAGTSGYAGINGTVNANGSTLRYDVTSDASTTLSAPSGFTSQGYQLSGNATLNLASASTFGRTLLLAGTGTVNNTANITTTNAQVLQSTSVIQPGSSSTASTALTINNSGTLTMNRTSNTVYQGAGVVLGNADTLTNSGTISLNDSTTSGTLAAVTGGAAITNTGTISAVGGYGINAAYGYPLTITNTGTIRSNQTAVALAYATSVVNSGSIISTSGAALGDVNGSSISDIITNLAGGTITGVGAAIRMQGGVVSNAGTINGDVDLSYSYYGQPYGYTSSAFGTYVANGGVLNGNLTFGGGSNLLIETGSGYGVTGTITSVSGYNGIGHQRSGTASVTLGGALPTNFTQEFTVAAGAGSRVTINGQSAYTSNIYVGGDGTIVNQLATTGGVYSLAYGGFNYAPYNNLEMVGFVNRANIGSVALNAGAFDNSATIGSSTLTGNAVQLTTLKGLTFNNSGTILNKGTASAVSLLGWSTTANSTIANSGTITGGISMSVGSSADTSVSITNSGTITGYTQSYYVYDPASALTVNYALNAVVSGVKSLSLNNSGSMTGNISLMGADVSLVNTGTIVGNIATGAGNDAFTLGGMFVGALNGGAGRNTLAINGGTQSFSSVSNVTSLAQSGGFASVSGVAAFGTVGLTGGRLVGLGGSVINASSIAVGSGATFGSAGTVNGNISVSGILSPGASPGTMTVNGNVTLNGGSTSQFEITPTAQDKLNINGTLVIASGSTLQIVASTPVKAGSTLNLISASGGITGTYDTVTGLPGVVKTQANGDLGLLVQFANSSNYNPQVQRAITYVNNAMAASGAPAALFPALSALQDGNGAPIASAFARITPEPYADAMQIGVETALSLAATTRMLGEGEISGPAHVFSFGQMMGSLRQFNGQEIAGINRASINGYGALGGIGVAGRGYALSGYIGWMDQSQSVNTIGASTQARGVVGGLAMRVGERGTRATLSISFDGARARTSRNVPDAGLIVGSYTLPSVSLDASFSHAFALSQGWQLRPQVGATWVRTHHGAMSEASAHPFALSVDQARRTQSFLDAGLGLESPAETKGPWRGFLTLGMRYRLGDGANTATAALAGNGYGLVAYGVERSRVDATLATGIEYRMAPGAALFLNASGEMGDRGKRESMMAGVRWRM